MLEYLAAVLLGTFALGLATWHAARVLAEGSLFEAPRDWLEGKAKFWWLQGGSPMVTGFVPVQPWHFIYEAVACRLCLNTQVACVLTWVALGVALAVGPSQPAAYWALALAVGPLVTAGWAEVIRRVEGISTP